MNTLMLLSASDTGIGDAALYALVGFVIVLLVLALLVGIFYLMGFLFRTKALSKEKLFERKPKASKNSVGESADETSDEELFAVISAVISSIYDGETPQGEVKPDFVIRRISRNKNK
ncbi:MAG: OadG family protein [Clostridia bacterium]|nr:OadG family protein [Clostridia bacterium]